MALPTTITGTKFPAHINTTPQASLGPFLSSTGNVYVVVLDTTNSKLHVYKATDPTSAFSEQDSAHIPAQGADGAVHVLQRGDLLKIAAGTSSSNPAYKFHQFDMATDLWSTTLVDRAILSPTIASAAHVAISMVQRSDGSLVAFANGATDSVMGAARERGYWVKSTDNGSTWGTATLVTGLASSANDGLCQVAILGASDRIHFMYLNPWPTLIHRSLTSADVLETASGSLGGGVVEVSGPGLTYVAGGNTLVKVLMQQTSASTALIQSISFTSGASPTFTTTTVSAAAGQSAPAVTGAVDETTVYVLWARGSDSDLLRDSQADGGSFGTDTVEFTGTINAVTANVYTRGASVVLAYLIDDGGTLKYNEVVLRTIATGPSPTDTLVGSEAVTLRLSASTAATDTLALSETVTVRLGATSTATDTLVVSDTATLSLGVAASGIETLAVSETVALSVSTTATATDTLVGSDDVSVSRGAAQFAPEVQDTVAVGEAVDRNLLAFPVATDTTALTELLGYNVLFFHTAADTLATAEVSLAQTDLQTVSADTLTLTDTVVATVGVFVALSDTVALPDNGAGTAFAFPAVTDVLASSDTLLVNLVALPGVTDTASLADTTSSILLTPVVVTDSTSLSETLAADIVTQAETTDTISLLETIEFPAPPGAPRLITMTDTLALLDSPQGQVFVQAGVSEAVSLTDSLVVMSFLFPTRTDTVTLGETLTFWGFVFPSVSDNILTSDSPSGNLTPVFSQVTDTVTLAEDLVVVLGTTLVIAETDTVSLSDTPGLFFRQLDAVIIEGLALGETAVGSFGLRALGTETLAMAETRVLLLVAFPVTSDTVTTSETIQRTALAFPQITDVVAFSELTNVGAGLACTVSEPILLTETVTGALVDILSVIDTLSMGDETALQLALAADASETLVLLSSTMPQAFLFPSASDILTLTTTPTLAVEGYIYHQLVTDVVTLGEDVTLRMRGLLKLRLLPGALHHAQMQGDMLAPAVQRGRRSDLVNA